MIRRFFLAATVVISALLPQTAFAQLTAAQLVTLGAYIATVPAWVAMPSGPDTASFIRDELNKDSAFIVFKRTEQTDKIGRSVSYIAIEAMTALNLDKAKMFYQMNPEVFEPVKADVRSFWANVLSGTLGGAGQASRDAMDALYRRPARDAERVFALGTGTTLAPGTLVFEGSVTYPEVLTARGR